MKRPTPPPLTPEQYAYTCAIGAFLAGRITEEKLRIAHARAYPHGRIAKDKMGLMRRLRCKRQPK